MGFGPGKRRRGSISVTLLFIGVATFVSTDPTHLFAQENYRQVDNSTMSLPAEPDPEALCYTISLVEVSSEKAATIVSKWQLAGQSASTTRPKNSALSPKAIAERAALAPPADKFEIRISNALSDEQAEKLVELGKLIPTPEMIRQNGSEVHVRVGRQIPFVSAYETVKDQFGNDGATLQPKVVCLHDGIELDVTGTIDDQKLNVQLSVKLSHLRVTGFEVFAYEGGTLPVQQPIFSSSAIQTTCKVPISKTIGICSGSIKPESSGERAIPLIGRIPYVDKVFKASASASEPKSTIILIRC